MLSCGRSWQLKPMEKPDTMPAGTPVGVFPVHRYKKRRLLFCVVGTVTALRRECVYRFMGAVLLDQQNSCSHCSARIAQCQAQKHAGYTQRTDVIFCGFCMRYVRIPSAFLRVLLRICYGYPAVIQLFLFRFFALSFRAANGLFCPSEAICSRWRIPLSGRTDAPTLQPVRPAACHSFSRSIRSMTASSTTLENVVLYAASPLCREKYA